MVSSQEKSELLKAFKAIDLNGDGKLSKDEMMQGEIGSLSSVS